MQFFSGLHHEKSEKLSWGSHINNSFMDIIEAVYGNDKTTFDSDSYAIQPPMKYVSGKVVFIYPYGLCVHYARYDPCREFTLLFLPGYNYTYENMFLFVTDPAMLTYSSIDQLSHQGMKIFGLKKRSCYHF